MTPLLNISKKGAVWIYWIIFGFVVGCYGFVFMAMPPTHDDFSYMAEFIYYGVDANGHHNLIHGIKESVNYRFNYDVSRIGNMTGSLMLLAPLWVARGISAVCFALGMWLMTLLAGIRPGQIFKLITLSSLVIFGFLWGERTFCHMYAYNYIVEMPVFLYAVYAFINGRRINLWTVMPLCVLLGCWHEVYAAGFIASACAILIFKPEFRDRKRIAMIAATAAGLAILLSFPALWTRNVIREQDTLSFFKSEGYARLPYLWMVFTAMAMILTCLCKKSWRKLSLSPLNISTFTCGVILIPLAVAFGQPRPAWPAVFLSACSIVTFIFSRRWNSIALKSAAVVIFLFGAAHLVAVCGETLVLRDHIYGVLKAYPDLPKDSDEFFIDARYSHHAPALAFNQPDGDLFSPQRLTLISMWYYLGGEKINYIPQELKDYKPEAGEPMKSSPDIRLYKGLMVSSNLADTTSSWAHIKYRHYTDTSPVSPIKFTADDGREYVYIFVQRSTLGRYMGKPLDIDFNVEF